jgi:hypothetical protein
MHFAKFNQAAHLPAAVNPSYCHSERSEESAFKPADSFILTNSSRQLTG